MLEVHKTMWGDWFCTHSSNREWYIQRMNRFQFALLFLVTSITTLNSFASSPTFSDAIKGKTVVALGESIHTSGGYHAAKADVIRFLVEKHGYRSIGFETNWGDTQLYSVWQSKEVYEMFDWLREFNRTHPKDQVSFHGFDIQQPWFDYPSLKKFLTTYAPGSVSTLMQKVDACLGSKATSIQTYGLDAAYLDVYEKHIPVTESAQQSCLKGIDQIERAINAAKGAARDSRFKAKLSIIGIRAMQWFHYYWNRDPGKGLGFHDAGMAKIHLMFAGKKKSVVWAHNVHISRGNDLITTPGYLYAKGKAMGGYLADALGLRFLSVGLLAYEVHVNHVGYQDPPLKPFQSLEAQLHRTGVKSTLFDARLVGRNLQWVGYADGEGTEFRIVPSQQFDWILFLDRSWGMQAI